MDSRQKFGQETFTLSNESSNDQSFNNKVETVTGNSEKDVAEQLEKKDENEALVFKQRVETAEKEDGGKAEGLRIELQIQEEEQQAMSAKAIEAREALESVVDSIQEKKIPIIERIENETHFKEAFPALSFFSWFGIGRGIAKTMYPDEYKLKVQNKEEADENTLGRLNERELEAKAQIASLEANGEINSQDELNNMIRQLEAVTTLLKEIEELEKEAENLTKKGPELTSEPKKEDKTTGQAQKGDGVSSAKASDSAKK